VIASSYVSQLHEEEDSRNWTSVNVAQQAPVMTTYNAPYESAANDGYAFSQPRSSYGRKGY
jgi:hypothetical protein